ncbi:YTH domain-containing family protein 2 [Spathaspora sp. JA1]|nr:YTH domain-containing family protein 2 [Spathaspora sp. JA1]
MFDDFDPIPTTFDYYYFPDEVSDCLTSTTRGTGSGNVSGTGSVSIASGSISGAGGSISESFSSSSLGFKYYTPRSLSTVLSIESEIDEISLNFKPNIWSSNFNNELSNGSGNPLIKFKPVQYNDDVGGGVADYINIPSDPSSPLTATQMLHYQDNTHTNVLFNSPRTSISNNNNNISQSYSSSNMSTSTTINNNTTIPPANCLTFRTYKGTVFTVPQNSKFFVIKSYNIVDVNASFTNNIWTSTELGNRRLDKAYQDLQITGNANIDGKIFLFFSVNSSGKFCGIAEMKSRIDYTKTSDIWVEQTRWKGIFPVEWLLIKDVPNRFFQHLKIPSNEFKPVTNSRDTQEIPFEIGISMLKIISSFRTND